MASKKATKSSSPFGALGAIRDKLPEGSPPRAWLVATCAGAPCGWLAVTRYRQTIAGPLVRPTLAIPGFLATLSLIEGDDGCALLQVERFQLSEGEGRREATSGGASVHVDGKPIVTVGESRTLDATTVILLRTIDGQAELRLTTQQPDSPQQPPLEARARPPRPKGADLTLRGGTQRSIEDRSVSGWIALGASSELSCNGDLECLGVALETGSTLRCRELVANVVFVEHRAKIEAARIRARVVHFEERALEELIERGVVTADYLQHYGRDLNPSFDYVRGELRLRPAFHEQGRDAGAPVVLDERAIREALLAGENVFTDGELLVPWR